MKVHKKGMHGTNCSFIFNYLQDVVAKCPPVRIQETTKFFSVGVGKVEKGKIKLDHTGLVFHIKTLYRTQETECHNLLNCKFCIQWVLNPQLSLHLHSLGGESTVASLF